MNIEFENLSWSDTGKYWIAEVKVATGDGFFFEKKSSSFKMHCVSNKDISEEWKGRESIIVEKLMDAKNEWIYGIRYISAKIENPKGIDITARIYKNTLETT